MSPIQWLNQISETSILFIAARSIDVCIAFAVITFIWLLIKQRSSAKLGYCLFLLVLLKLMVPGFVSLPMPAFYDSIAIDNSNAAGAFLDGQTYDEHAISAGAVEGANLHTEANVNKANGNSQTQSAVSNNPSIVNQLGWQTYIFALWFIGVFCFLAFIIRNEYKTWRWIHNTKPIDQNQFPVDIGKLQSKANVSFPIKYQQADWAQSPLAYGILSPTIVLPADLHSNFTKQQIEWIILHELAHLKNRDPLVSLVQRLLQAMFFFHPIVWWTNHIIDTQREYVCDDFATSVSQVNPKECGEGLLGVAMQNSGLPTFWLSVNGITKNKTYIRRRMMRILEAEQSKVKFNTAVILLTMCALILPFNLQQAVSQETGEATFDEFYQLLEKVNEETAKELSYLKVESTVKQTNNYKNSEFLQENVKNHPLLNCTFNIQEESFHDGVAKGKVNQEYVYSFSKDKTTMYNSDQIFKTDGNVEYYLYPDKKVTMTIRDGELNPESFRWVMGNDDDQTKTDPISYPNWGIRENEYNSKYSLDNRSALHWLYYPPTTFSEMVHNIEEKLPKPFIQKIISNDVVQYDIIYEVQYATGYENYPSYNQVFVSIYFKDNRLYKYIRYNALGNITEYYNINFNDNIPSSIQVYKFAMNNYFPKDLPFEDIGKHADYIFEIDIHTYNKLNFDEEYFDYENKMENGHAVYDHITNEYYIIGDEASKQPLDQMNSDLPNINEIQKPTQ